MKANELTVIKENKQAYDYFLLNFSIDELTSDNESRQIRISHRQEG